VLLIMLPSQPADFTWACTLFRHAPGRQAAACDRSGADGMQRALGRQHTQLPESCKAIDELFELVV
jgi:hypothetical protein